MSHTRSVFSGLMTKAQVKQRVKELEAKGCVPTFDDEAGTVLVKDGDTVVFRGLEKGPRQPWIIMHFDSDRITWQRPAGWA